MNNPILTIRLGTVIRRFTECFKPHYLLHIIVDGAHGNTFINQPIAFFIAEQRALRRKVVVAGAWKISSAEYLKLKAGRKS